MSASAIANPFDNGATPPPADPSQSDAITNPFESSSGVPQQGSQDASLDNVANGPNDIPLDSHAHATERGLASIGQGAAQAVQSAKQLITHPIDTAKQTFNAAKQLPSQAVAVAKNPPSLSEIGDVAGQTAGNLIAGEAMGEAAKAAPKLVKAATTSSDARVAAPIKATIPEAAAQPDKAVAASDRLYQAVAPTKTDTGFRANVHAAAGDLAQTEVDWDSARGGKGMTRGSAPPDMRVRAAHDAVNDHMGEMYKAEVEPKINAVQSTPAKLAANPDAYNYLAQTAGDESTRNLAAKAAKNPQAVTVGEAYQLAKTVNAELNSFERLDPAQQYQVRATNPGINKLNGLDETLNKTINDSLQSRGLPGIQNFERRYAAMAAVRRNLAGRMNEVELRRQGLMDRTVGKVAKAAMGRNVNAIASASAASLADVNVGDYVEKSFKDLKASGVKPQLDAQPGAPKLTLQPSGSMPPAAQRPLSFMDNPNTNQSGPVYPGGKGNAPAPKTSAGTRVLSGEKPAPAPSSNGGTNNFKTFADIGFNADADNKALAQAKAEQAAGKLNGKSLVQRAQEIKEQLKAPQQAQAASAGSTVQGAPNRFLKLMGADEKSVVRSPDDEATVQHFQQKIKSGQSIPEPTLTVDKNNSIISGDGRHRLLAYQREGVDSVKVKVSRTGEEGVKKPTQSVRPGLMRALSK